MIRTIGACSLREGIPLGGCIGLEFVAGSCLVRFGKGRPDLLPLVGWITIRIGLGVVVVVGADPRRGGATVASCVDRKVLILVCLRAVTSSRGRGAGGRVESVSCMIVRHLGEKWPWAICFGTARHEILAR